MADAQSFNDVQWSPRAPKWKLRRVYGSACAGLWDAPLIDDVGMTLFLRRRDIVNIHRAQSGERKITCPRCDRAGTESLISRPRDPKVPIACPACGWSLTWVEYHRTFQRRQLNPGGAINYFQDFVRSYPLARTPQDKMLAIDRVIHEFHYSIRELPDQASRAAGVNLIDGNLTQVLAFLNDLSGLDLPVPMRQTFQTWQQLQDSIRWDDIAKRKRVMKKV